MAACGIDLILNAEVSGTTSTQIGSARILSGSNSYISFRALFGCDTASTGSIEFKRFTGGSSVTELTSSGMGLQDISGSGATFAALGIVDDWYDIYASGSSSSGSVIVKGIKVTLY